MVMFEKVEQEQSRDPNSDGFVRHAIIAEEEESDEEDNIPGPSPNGMQGGTAVLDLSKTSIDLSDRRMKGQGILASLKDLRLPADEFADGCKLLQQAALGNQAGIEELLKKRPSHINFRDYDRRTALHVAASEGHLDICQFLVGNGARINRSDRWGGSALDDAHRHRHQDVIAFLRKNEARSGSASHVTNLINAAAEGDIDEVKMILKIADVKPDDGDYDRRTALHLAAGEGHKDIVQFLCESGANVNVEDRWGGRPYDDAVQNKHRAVVKILEKHGATKGSSKKSQLDESATTRRETANLKIDFDELEMIDRIGSGAFGEIYKCRWRGTLVAAKCIKSARIRQTWLKTQAMKKIESGGDVDEAIAEIDEAEMTDDDKEAALHDFRQEVSILKSLRHPHIVLLLAFSTTQNHEVMISELMKCSLLDVCKAHIVHGTKMKKRDKVIYATHLAQGMLYLHTCKPPIVHRDLKPANLLIDYSGVLKVADFGLCKIRPDPSKGETDHFTMTGETGSYRFMAPEVYRHENYTETVDVYSYAMILYYLLDGLPPWPYLNGVVAVRKAANEGDRPPVPRSWDHRLQALLQECWSENPHARPTFKAILKVLNDYSHDVFKADSDTFASVSSIDGKKSRCGTSCVIS